MDQIFVLGMDWILSVFLPHEIQPVGFVVIPPVPMASDGFLVTDSGAHGAGPCLLRLEPGTTCKTAY